METPGKLNITFRPGADFELPLVWKDAKKKPVNLTGFNALMQVRQSANSPDVIVELSTANGRIALGPGGSIRVFMSAAETAQVVTSVISGVYDLLILGPGGTRDPLIEGKVSIKPVVSK